MLNQVQHDADFFIPAQAGSTILKKWFQLILQKNNNKSREQTNTQINKLTN
jgi:hypothetical protein